MSAPFHIQVPGSIYQKRSANFVFYLKSWALILKRWISSPFSKRYYRGNKLTNAPVISSSESELWNADDTDQNRILTAGKIQNLRIACKCFNGIEVPAGAVLSFWKQVGYPSRFKGYVTGREIREGCIIPTTGGGLCQLSNALYDAALKAGFEIIERHRHTKVIKGSLAERDRDATVKWNYIDLRFRARHSFRIEIEMTVEKLIVRFRALEKKERAETTNRPLVTSTLNDCYSCGHTTCFRHPGSGYTMPLSRSTTFILDERWPEYEKYIFEYSSKVDVILIAGKNWKLEDAFPVKKLTLQAFGRRCRLALGRRIGKNIFSEMLGADERIAKSLAKYIPVQSTHLVISQNLLPFLWKAGALGGRTFDVLMTRLPFEILQQRLDEAYRLHAESGTLHDFRAPAELVTLENQALTRARHIITPHTELAALFRNKVTQLEWEVPPIKKKHTPGKRVLFPASALGRKGAYEMRQLAIDLDLELVIAGHTIEEKNFWKNVKVELRENDVFKDVGLVIFPAWVEHQPRLVLQAISMGIPVIVSKSCGLKKGTGIHILADQDPVTLATEVKHHVFPALMA